MAEHHRRYRQDPDAIGLSGSVAPDLGRRPVSPGDRILLTTASRYFAVTPRLMNAVAAAHADSSLQYWIAALAEAARSSAAPEGVTIVAAEVGRVTSFVT
jgi:hypothetical protein